MYWPLGTPRVYTAKGTYTPDRVPDNSEQGDGSAHTDNAILLDMQVSRNGHLFATITSSRLDIWQTSPAVVLASVVRSTSSLKSYGNNVNVLLRPDSSVAAVRTSQGFLVTYNINVDPSSRVYQHQRQDEKTPRQTIHGRTPVHDWRIGQREVHIRFRMIIKIDAGISKALALDEDLLVATEKPAAVQCIRWVADSKTNQTSTELLNRMPWMGKKATVTNIIYDRAMGLFVWITDDGRAYAVQRLPDGPQKPDISRRIFRGYCFHAPNREGMSAEKAAINARFSLLAVGCADGEVLIYTARDYVGSIPLSHKLTPPASPSTTGAITFLIYSPDGYCLFVGYQHGWVMWSVYGKLGGNSFVGDRSIAREQDDLWLSGTRDGSWVDGGSAILFTSQNESRLWVLETVRSAVTGCYGPSTTSRMLLHSGSGIMVYRGHDLLDLVSVSADPSLWHHAQFPASYLTRQRPIRAAVISPDGRYVAIAGRRGLAHYSVNSGRWKTFDDPNVENSFVVRGGMCWYQHILIVAVEVEEHHEVCTHTCHIVHALTANQLRLYSRELGLNESSLVFVERLSSPLVAITPTGEDSLLVYTFENNLYHYVITASGASVHLVQVGQIGLHGIVRAPARVRAVTWYIPEHQLLDGDPSQDVVHASVLFLVDAKLVLLQPSKGDEGALKYAMRIIANDVEYFTFMRDHNLIAIKTPEPLSALEENGTDGVQTERSLQESLWFFDGRCVRCWTDFQDLLKSAAVEGHKDLLKPVSVLVDFYPTAIALNNGVVIGIEPDLVQRRDAQFAFFRFSIRTQLFLPAILRHYLSTYDSPSALNLAHHYQHLSYFPHALEVLLHTVLDEEVDTPPAPEQALLPSVLSFLSSFPDYLDILVQCTRKTEVRSWRTLFKYLPPPLELFEESLEKGLLKTAGGYLLILHTFEELDSSSEQCIRLLQMAKEAADWELCKELARFLMALDESGESLRQVMQRLDLGDQGTNGHSPEEVTYLQKPLRRSGRSVSQLRSLSNGSSGGNSPSRRSVASNAASDGPRDSLDYFSSKSQ